MEEEPKVLAMMNLIPGLKLDISYKPKYTPYRKDYRFYTKMNKISDYKLRHISDLLELRLIVRKTHMAGYNYNFIGDSESLSITIQTKYKK